VAFKRLAGIAHHADLVHASAIIRTIALIVFSFPPRRIADEQFI